MNIDIEIYLKRLKDFFNNEKSGSIPVVINDSEIIPAIIK